MKSAQSVSFYPLLLVPVLIFVAAGPAGAQEEGSAREGFSPVQAMQIVDCLLPGQVRRVGGRTYVTQRRPTRTTAQDCEARGGEFLLYDRAQNSSAIAVWTPRAQEGDPEAQTILGEIYEHGSFGEPDYANALLWYRRAADQGNARAQFNLGTLYEQGLGVDQDRLAALNWYRQASGLEEDSLIFQSAAQTEIERRRTQLEEQIEQRDRQIEVLEAQIEELQQRIDTVTDASEEDQATIESINSLLAQLLAAREADNRRLSEIPQPTEAVKAVQTFSRPKSLNYLRRDFGRFYALVVGVQEYDLLDDLASPAADMDEIGGILESRYGFSVVKLANPDQVSLMRAINQLNETLREDDNLLIYFSGYGSRLGRGTLETGYWLPSNADPSPNDTLWVPNEFVSRHLGRISARRVLVLADSLYAGLLGNEPGFIMIGDGTYGDQYIEWKMPKRSRLVLSSGTEQPVAQGDSADRHSIFARALLDVLMTTENVITAPELLLLVRQRVRVLSGDDGAAVPDPELRALKDAGHEVGDFFLIPRQS